MDKAIKIFFQILLTILVLGFVAGLTVTWVSTFILGYYYATAGIFAIVVMGAVVPLVVAFLTVISLYIIWKK